MDPSTGSVVYKTSTTMYWFEADGILRSKIFENAVIDLDAAKENESTRNKLIGDTKRLLLVDIVGIKKISQEARSYTQKSATRNLLIAVAIVVGSPLTKIIGSFAIGFNKPEVDTKLFTSAEESLVWLNAIKHK